MAENVCTCPPLADVFRGRAGETCDPCPVHPVPDLRGVIVKSINVGPSTTIAPIAWHR